jgi:hypothetical protein
MRRVIAVCVLMLLTISAVAGTKDKGSTSLKDVQPAGTVSKNHKQQYDLFFTSTSGKDYTCRTSEKKSVKATDLAIGSSVTYEVNGDKGKVKTSADKKFDCTIVRVANASSAAPK